MHNNSRISISFGMIVLNGEPFIRYNLRNLYPYAHQILVVEGAVASAASIATPDGHSRDNTLKIVRDFMLNDDPDNKVTLITRDGFWEEKDMMSQAFAEKATGNYLWQVDVDEFYKPADIEKMISYLRSHPDTTGASFRTITFWGSPDYVVDSWRLQHGARDFHRLFKWEEGYQYYTHRPVTVIDDRGEDLRSLAWLSADETHRLGINLYHYSLLLPSQVREKVEYYQQAQWNTDNQMVQWAKTNYFQLSDPFYVHNVRETPSWLVRFRGQHPALVGQMWNDLQGISWPLRDMRDVDRVTSSPIYRTLCLIMRILSLIYKPNSIRRRFSLWVFIRIVKPISQIQSRLRKTDPN